MLVYGTANPEGHEGGCEYGGVYLTDKDIDEMTPTMVGTPVKIEHKGSDIGKVVSAWKHKDGRMDLVLEIDKQDQNLETVFGKEFVKRGICKDLSLGYQVQMSMSPAGRLRAGNKRVVEVSIVKTGARKNCHIRGWSSGTVSSHQKNSTISGLKPSNCDDQVPGRTHRILV